MRLFLAIGSVANTPQPWIGDRRLSIIDHQNIAGSRFAGSRVRVRIRFGVASPAC
jgi:hypothetical protein